MKRRNRPISSPTSLAGRDQFSALKEKMVMNADADLGRRADRSPQSLDAAAMALHARQAARRRPAAIAVHDDADMTRRPLERRRGAMRNLGLGHWF